MRVNPTEHNVRRAKCPDCKRVLQKGEGVKYQYDMFGGQGQFFYPCPECDAKREAERIERENQVAARRAAEAMDREARAQGVDYE